MGRPAHVGRASGRRGRGHHPPRGHRPPRRRPRPARGRPGHGQDAARPRDRPQPRPRHGPGPGHARPAAVRRHRLEPVRADRAPLRRGPGVHEPPAGRRDQPRDAADAERAARGDAGAPGVRRGDDAPPAGPVPRDRDPEPGRVRGHVRAAAGAARPVPAARRGRLSRPARRAPDRPPPPGDGGPAGHDRARDRPRAAARAARPRADRPGRRRGGGLRRGPRARDADASRRGAGWQPAGDGRPVSHLAGGGGPRGTRLRDARRRQGGRARRADPPAGRGPRPEPPRRDGRRRARPGPRRRRPCRRSPGPEPWPRASSRRSS